MSNELDELDGMDRLSERLEHHGVPGMKWGVRKARGYAAERRVRKDALKSDNISSRRIQSRGKTWRQRAGTMDQLSSTDLRRSLNRLKLENQFNEELKKWPAKPTKPQSMAKKFIFDKATTLIKSEPVQSAIAEMLLGNVKGAVNKQSEGDSSKKQAKAPKAKSGVADAIKKRAKAAAEAAIKNAADNAQHEKKN